MGQKPNRDEVAAREAWIQDRLGERKYRQLRMHLSGALRLLGELAVVHDTRSAMAGSLETPADLRADTTKAMAALTERLNAFSPRQRTIPIRELQRVKARRKRLPPRG